MTKTRWVPEGANTFHSNPDLGIAIYTYQRGGKPVAIGYAGRAVKPTLHASYRDDAALREYVSRLETSLLERKARRKAVPHDVKVGDIFRASWGYDQTNIDYFQCVGLVGTTMGTFRAIASQAQETGFMSGDCVPAVGHFKGEPFRARIRGGENPAIGIYSFASAYRITPMVVGGVPIYEPSRWSSYA